MISSELQKIGLSEKEARVYLSALTLGPKSAQEIARHCGINRATCYIILENLIDLGFISQIEGERGKIFAPEDPSTILNLLDLQEQSIKKRKNEIQSIVPDLMALYNKGGSKPRVRFLEGLSGIREIQKMVIESKTKTIREITCLDWAFKNFEPRDFDEFRKQIFSDRNIDARGIVITKNYTLDYMPEFIAGAHEVRLVPPEKFEMPGELAICDTFASFVSHEGKPAEIIIEHEPMLKILKTWFDLAWEGAAKYQKNYKTANKKTRPNK